MHITLGGSSCFLSKSHCTIENTFLLLGLYTSEQERCKGSAKRLLRAIKKWAIRKNVSVLLYVGSFMDRPMDNGMLFKMYSKMGFVPFKPETIYNWMPNYMVFNFRV